MGEEFISKKKERFEHCRDAAVEEDFKKENLLSRLPDASTAVYRCTITSTDYKPAPGELVALAELGQGQVSVLDTNVVVGYVQTVDARKLLIALHGSSVKMLVAKVHSVGALTPTFTVALDAEAE